jgi:hypothetical protein
MRRWLRDVWDAVFTVAHGMWITMRYWLITYRPERRTFTEHFEYPELPVPVAARHVHRLRSMRQGLPGRLHLHRQGARDDRQRVQDHGLHDRLLEMHVLCAVRRALPGGLHLHGCHARPELLQSRRLSGGFFAAARRRGLGARDLESDGGVGVEGDRRTGPWRTESIECSDRVYRV